MKKTLSLFLALVMAVGIFCSVPFTQSPLKLTADAASKSDLKFELNWDEKSYLVGAYRSSEASGSLTIPATHKGLPVTGIVCNGFSDCTGLKSVTIPNSVINIGSYAFSGCTGLKSVTIPNSVTYICCEAFLNCKNMKTAQVGKNAYIDYQALGYYVDHKTYESKKISGFTIYGISGTPAQTYAKENGFKFVKVTKPGTVKLSGATNASTGVKVSWSKVDNISSYTLYRKSGSSGWKAIKTDIIGTSYTDTTAKSGTKYTYTVRATNVAGTGGYDKTGKTVTYLAMPKPSVTNASNGVTVKWSKVTGAKEYYVYRKSGNSGWKKIGTSKGTSYTDKTAKSGTSYTYTVRAYNGKTSSAYNTKGLTIKFLATPKLSSVANSTSGVTVKWGKVTGAKEYYVYRKSGNSGWKKIGTSKGTSYTDKTAKSGTTYTYTVRAYNGKTASAYNTKGLTIKFLAAPKLSSVTSAKSGVTFKWGKVTGASGYYVYRKTGNGSWQKIATVKGNSKVSYLDKSAKKGTTYTYTVRAYSGKTMSAYNTKGLKIKDKY